MLEAFYLLTIVLGIILSLAAFFVVMQVFFPERIEKTRRMLDTLPGRAFLVGLVNFVFFAAIAITFFALGNWTGIGLFSLLGLITLVIPGIGMVFGLASAVLRVGASIAPQISGVRRTVLGALVLGLACGLPFVGWFGLLPYVSLLGLGAFIISFFRNGKKAAPQSVQEDSRPPDNRDM